MVFTFAGCVHMPVGIVCLEHDYRILGFTGFGLCGCCGFIVILDLLFISVAVAKKLWLLIGFAGFLPVNFVFLSVTD